MGVDQNAIERLQEWRAAMGKLYLTGVTSMVPVLLVMWAFTRPPPVVDGPFLFVSTCWLSFLLARLFAPARVQAALVVALLAVVSIVAAIVMGLSPGPLLSTVSAVLLSGVVFGRRLSLALLAALSAAILTVGALTATGAIATVNAGSTNPLLFSNWIRVTVFGAITTGLLLYLLTGLFDRMEEAWRATAQAAERERNEQRQRHAAEERVVEAQRLEAVGKLAGGVAHDFNNLLLVIMAWADMLPRASEEERKEGLDAIRDAAAQAAQLTRQLLSFARRTVVQPRAVDVGSFIATTLKSLRRLVADDVKIDHLPSDVPRVLVDEAQLSQVVLNLVVNAADAMPRGGSITMRAALVAAAAVPPDAPDPNGRYVAVTVSDTGVGMDEATRARIFEPFFTTKVPGRGTGLGLASVYGIVSQARGWVAVKSQPGKGSTFTVAFPVAPENVEQTASRPTGVVGPAGSVPHRILLVEDNTAVRATMAAALRQAGIEPVEAANAADALILARRHRDEFELLCTDGVMPGLPTHVLIEGFRQLFPRAPVLLCSGHVEEDLIRRGIEEGSVAVLPKPFTAEALVAKVNELLAPKV